MIKLRVFAQALLENALQVVLGILILIVGGLITKWILKGLRILIGKQISNETTVSVITNSIGVLLYAIVAAATLIEIGAHPGRVVAFLVFVALGSVATIVIFRPLLPTLPFKVGNTVKMGNLFRKIEATTILNTRVRTFDGKTFFVPNRQILNDVVINYHYTKTRRVKVNVIIRYDQDLLHAKQVLETVMREDARALAKPAPVIFVLELGPAGVKLVGHGAGSTMSNSGEPSAISQKKSNTGSTTKVLPLLIPRWISTITIRHLTLKPMTC